MRTDLMLELAALKCIFCDRDGEELFRSLIAQDFSAPEYGNLFEAMLELAADGHGIDFASVCVKLNGAPWWEKLRGSAWLAAEVAREVPYSPQHAIAPALRELTILRLQEELKLGSGDVEKNIGELERARDQYLGLLPSQAKSVADFKKILQEKDKAGFACGFSGVDRLTGGFLGEQLIIVGARTGVGKSVFLMNIGAHVAMHGKSVLWISLEMSERENLKRFLQHIKADGDPDGLDYLATMRIVSGAKNIAQVESEAMRGKYDLVVLDYLQLCRSDRRFDSEVLELQDITRRLKLLAMKTGSVVLAAAQLNRDVEQSSRLPRLSDLRGSGSIEQDSDTVILLHRLMHDGEPRTGKRNLGADIVARALEGKGDTTVLVEKNRNGATGLVDMNFDPERLCFIDPAVPPAWVKDGI